MIDDSTRAVRCLVRASNAMLEPTSEAKAAALLWCARAMLYIAASDVDNQARALAEATIREVLQQRKAG